MRQLLAAAIALFAVAQSHSTPPIRTEGVFVDSQATRHSWIVNGAHTLIWEGNPYLPVGALLKLRSWTRDATNADWQADVAALEKLKAGKITDVCVTPLRGGITAATPEAIQRTIDYLEMQGFTYGIRINDGPHQPLIGYEVRPGAYRQEVPASGGILRFPVDGAASATAFVVNEGTNDVAEVRQAGLVGEEARVTMPIRTGDVRQVVILVPERIFPVGSSAQMPDLWNGFDEYRDNLITLFARVRLGKGFRFFADPLPADMALNDEFLRLMPTGTAWTSEWGSWLARRYKNMDNLQTSWALMSRELDDFSVAASLLPLWGGSKGVDYLYRRSNDKTYGVDYKRTAFWRDLTQFKAESVREYRNNLATALKKSIGDAPIVYSGMTNSALLQSLPAQRGFDGIAVATPGAGRGRVLGGAANLYAHAAEAPKTLWLPAFVTAAEEDGYPSGAALNNDFDALREIGVRGFFAAVTPETVTQGGTAAYLAGYRTLLTQSSVGLAADAPGVIFYPRTLANMQVRQLASGAWWLPTDRPYTPLELGKLGRGYFFNDAQEDGVYVLWNPQGTQPVRFTLPKAAMLKNAPRILVGNGEPGKVDKGVLTLTLTPEPLRLVNFPGLPIPIDAFDTLKAEAQTLAAYARTKNRDEAGKWSVYLTNTAATYRADNPWPMFKELSEMVRGMRASLRPYIWLEAELANRHTFDEVIAQPGSSNFSVLNVGKRARTNGATLLFNRAIAPEKGDYQIWIAATPGARLTVRIDGQPLDETVAARPAGALFAEERLVWASYGVITLPAGAHSVEVRADGAAMVDAILLTRGDFVPNGTVMPPVP